MNENEYLQKRMDELEKRVAYLERQLLEEEVVQKIEPIQEKVEEVMMISEPIKPVQPVKPPKPNKLAREPIQWEKVIGQIWLPRIFTFILILGVVWAYKIGVEYGYIPNNEYMRVLMGMIVGGGVHYYGLRQLKENRRPLGLALVAGSVLIWFLSIFAGHYLFGIIPAWMAFCLNLIVLAYGVYRIFTLKAPTLAAIYLSAGMFLPFLIDEPPNLYVFVGFEGILLAVSLWLTLRFKKELNLYLSTFTYYVSLLVFNVRAFELIGNNEDLKQTILNMCFVQLVMPVVIYCIGLFMEKTWNENRRLGIVIGLFAFATIFGYEFVDEWVFNVYLTLGIAVTGMVAYFTSKRPILGHYFIAKTFILLTVAIGYHVDEKLIPTLLFIQGCINFYFAFKLRAFWLKVSTGFSLIVATYLSAEFYRMFIENGDPFPWVSMMNSVMLVAVVIVITVMSGKKKFFEKHLNVVTNTLDVAAFALWLFFILRTITVYFLINEKWIYTQTEENYALLSDWQTTCFYLGLYSSSIVAILISLRYKREWLYRGAGLILSLVLLGNGSETFTFVFESMYVKYDFIPWTYLLQAVFFLGALSLFYILLHKKGFVEEEIKKWVRIISGNVLYIALALVLPTFISLFVEVNVISTVRFHHFDELVYNLISYGLTIALLYVAVSKKKEFLVTGSICFLALRVVIDFMMAIVTVFQQPSFADGEMYRGFIVFAFILLAFRKRKALKERIHVKATYVDQALEGAMFLGSVVTMTVVMKAVTYDLFNGATFFIDIERFAITIGWFIVAISHMLMGRKMEMELMKKIGFIFLFVTLVKLICFDAFLISITFAAFLFIIIGIAGIIVSRLYYNSDKSVGK